MASRVLPRLEHSGVVVCGAIKLLSANLTTHCRFNDVPFGESVQGGRRSDDGREPLPSTLSV